MKPAKMLKIWFMAVVVLVCSAQLAGAEPMGTAFTYQGQLYDANYPANGSYDFSFKLYDAASDGNQVGVDVNLADVNVVDGYFTVKLDFGIDVFSGDARWLGTGIRLGVLNDPNSYTNLSPRQEVTPTPHAIYAESSKWDNLIDIPADINDGDDVGGGVPPGGIIMWSGAIVDIPSGWALCDGTDGTPNLTSRFIRSVPNASTDPGSTGGSSTHTHSAGSYSASSHTHSYSGTTSQGNEIEYCNSGSQQVPARITHTHTYSGTTGSGGGGSISGTSGEASSLPPYYELAYIMKLP